MTQGNRQVQATKEKTNLPSELKIAPQAALGRAEILQRPVHLFLFNPDTHNGSLNLFRATLSTTRKQREVSFLVKELEQGLRYQGSDANPVTDPLRQPGHILGAMDCPHLLLKLGTQIWWLLLRPLVLFTMYCSLPFYEMGLFCS